MEGTWSVTLASMAISSQRCPFRPPIRPAQGPALNPLSTTMQVTMSPPVVFRRQGNIDDGEPSSLLKQRRSRTQVRVAAAAVRVVQLAVLERHLPEGRLGVAELHGAHRAAAAGLRRTHRLQGPICVPLE